MGHPINPVPPIIVLTIVGDTEDTPVAVRCALFESFKRNGPNHVRPSIGWLLLFWVKPVSGVCVPCLPGFSSVNCGSTLDR